MEYKLNLTHIRAREARQVGQYIQTLLRSCWKVKCGANQYRCWYISTNLLMDGWFMHTHIHICLALIPSAMVFMEFLVRQEVPKKSLVFSNHFFYELSNQIRLDEIQKYQNEPGSRPDLVKNKFRKGSNSSETFLWQLPYSVIIQILYVVLWFFPP